MMFTYRNVVKLALESGVEDVRSKIDDVFL